MISGLAKSGTVGSAKLGRVKKTEMMENTESNLEIPRGNRDDVAGTQDGVPDDLSRNSDS